MTTRQSKSDFEFNTLFSGYTRTKTDQEKEMDKKMFHGRQTKVAKLAAHGFYEDTSMAANDRKELRHKMQLKRKQSSMNRLHTNFEKEVHKVQELQRKLAAYQEAMAVTALEKYTITFIQSVWRGYCGRRVAKQFRAVRFLSRFLWFRSYWRRMSGARRVIKRVYQKFRLLRALKHLVKPSFVVKVIQRAYRRRFLRTRALIRLRAHATWRHIRLFGLCRANNALSPLDRQRRVVANLFMRFHRRIRARRVFNAANVNNLFLGLYFCQHPLACKKVRAAASFLPDSARAQRKKATALPAELQSQLSRDIVSAMAETKIKSSLEKAAKLEETQSVTDALAYMKRQVVKSGLRKMDSVMASGSPLLGSRSSRGALRSRGGGAVQLKRQLSLGSGTGSKPTSNSESLANKSIMLQSVNAYRQSVQNYKVPARLMNLAAHSQLDPNSLFASQLSSKTNKVIPYELKGFFRLKTFVEVVWFLQDLTSATIKCPELLDDPFAELNAANDPLPRSGSLPLDDEGAAEQEEHAEAERQRKLERVTMMDSIANIYPSMLLTTSAQQPPPQDRVAPLTRGAPLSRSNSKRVSIVSARGKPLAPPAISSKLSTATATATTTATAATTATATTAEKQAKTNNSNSNSNSGGGGGGSSSGSNSRTSSNRNSLDNSHNRGAGSDVAKQPAAVISNPPQSATAEVTPTRDGPPASAVLKPTTPPNKRVGAATSRNKDVVVVKSASAHIERADGASAGEVPIPTPALAGPLSALPVIKKPSTAAAAATVTVSDSDGSESSSGHINFADHIREEEAKFFESIKVIHNEVLMMAEQEKKQRSSQSRSQLSALTCPELSQSTITVPDMCFHPTDMSEDSASYLSRASSMNSDDEEDEYDDDFDSVSMSRSMSRANTASAGGKRPSRPTTPVPSSAYYRRQNLLLGATGKKK